MARHEKVTLLCLCSWLAARVALNRGSLLPSSVGYAYKLAQFVDDGDLAGLLSVFHSSPELRCSFAGMSGVLVADFSDRHRNVMQSVGFNFITLSIIWL